MRRPVLPGNAGAAFAQAPQRNVVDAFVFAELRARGLRPSPEASRRTLIRRLYFDLLGLAPPPDQIQSFLGDPNPLAYERLVDRLLSSPQYGERWARHWLDVVHFGETHGYDKDKPRMNAWPYRDYVIRSLNQGKPFTRFVQEQLAGDVLFPGTRDGIEALGFIAAGPWDFIGHAEVPETKIDGRIARHLDRDDMVSNSLQTFTSLTVQCAQCHHHKFDPISMEEYYSLHAVFAAVDRTEVKYDRDPVVAARRAQLESTLKASEQRRKELSSAIEQRDPTRFAELDREIQSTENQAKRQSAKGYHSQIASEPNNPKWVQVDLGQSHQISRLVLHATEDAFNGIGKGFGFPVEFDLSVSDDPEFKTGVVTIARGHKSGDAPRQLRPVTVEVHPAPSARHVRVTAPKLVLRQNDYIFALAELEVFSGQSTNLALKAKVSAADSIESAPSWAKANLTDGFWPGQLADEGAVRRQLEQLQSERRKHFDQWTRGTEGSELRELDQRIQQWSASLKSLPAPSLVYAGAVHTGSGAFKGTGGAGGKPRTIHVLARGNILAPGAEAAPGPLQSIPGVPRQFQLAPGHREGDRRAELARWICHPEHPFTWRSIANRVWQYHFGRGIVETPNDFGKMGAQPTHSALLDWLAIELRDGEQSLKSLSRLIVTSHTYRQSSAVDDQLATKDVENRYLWRMNRRKLDAESIRDACLQAAGSLDLKMHGPSFQDFVIEKPEHSPHYEYHLHDPGQRATHRRTIYRFLVRSQPQPFMASLDCADPSMLVARRNETQSPTQALALLNNPLMLAMSSKMAGRIERESPRIETQIALAHERILGRAPIAQESTELTRFAHQHGLANVCRLLFNLNEFLFID